MAVQREKALRRPRIWGYIASKWLKLIFRDNVPAHFIFLILQGIHISCNLNFNVRKLDYRTTKSKSAEEDRRGLLVLVALMKAGEGDPGSQQSRGWHGK